jgi:hypothetical protein
MAFLRKTLVTVILLAVTATGAGCTTKPLQCENTKVAYWQDKKEPKDGYKYKLSIQCELADGTTPTVTPLASKTKIPACK